MIDIDKIKDYTGADEGFIASLFQKFLSHLDADLETLRTEASKEDWQAVKKKTHAMLSSARIFHLDPIVALSTQLEANVDHHNFSNIGEMTQRLIKLYLELELELKEWISVNS